LQKHKRKTYKTCTF